MSTTAGAGAVNDEIAKSLWIISVLGVLVVQLPCSLRKVHLATVGTPLQSASKVML